MKSRLLLISGMVMVFGGIWLPAFGTPQWVGGVCSVVGYLFAFLGAELSRKDWLSVGILLGLAMLGVLLPELGQPNAWLRMAGIACLLAGMLFGGCWLVLRVRKVSKTRMESLDPRDAQRTGESGKDGPLYGLKTLCSR